VSYGYSWPFEAAVSRRFECRDDLSENLAGPVFGSELRGPVRRNYSPINDLYGVEPEGRRSGHGSTLWLLIVIILAGLFFYKSIHPVMRLRDDLPPDFVEAGANPSIAELREQERIARAYWELAVETVQEQYPFGTTLPASPPQEFTLQGESDSAARTRFWNKLRERWDQREIWVRRYGWDADWVKDAWSSLRGALNNYLQVQL
jgi:hypothetical protein